MANTTDEDPHYCNDIAHYDKPTYPSPSGWQACNECHKLIPKNSPRFGCNV